MRAIKNFFHNISDILLALIIVLIASGIIYWRLGIILDYPKQLAAEQASYLQESSEESADNADADTSDETEDAEDAEDKPDTEEPQG